MEIRLDRVKNEIASLKRKIERLVKKREKHFPADTENIPDVWNYKHARDIDRNYYHNIYTWQRVTGGTCEDLIKEINHARNVMGKPGYDFAVLVENIEPLLLGVPKPASVNEAIAILRLRDFPALGISPADLADGAYDTRIHVIIAWYVYTKTVHDLQTQVQCLEQGYNSMVAAAE